MKIGIPDDYQDAVRILDCFQKLNGQQVVIFREHISDPEALFGAAFDQLLAFAAGNRMNVANPEALEHV